MPNLNETFGSFQVTLTAAGTRQTVATPAFGQKLLNTVVIKAMAANAGKIFLGDNTVTAANGLELSAGDALSLDAESIETLYFDGGTTGDKLSVFWAGP